MELDLKDLKEKELLIPVSLSLSKTDIQTLNTIKRQKRVSRSKIIRYCIESLRKQFSNN